MKETAKSGRPETGVSDPSVLAVIERQQTFFDSNETLGGLVKDECLHELFQEQAKRSPGAVAVSHEGRELSYRELDVRSNQLAHLLRELGVGPETLVAICLKRSPKLIVGLLGILKAGGAYVPLNPDYPAERLAFMLQDTGAPVLLTNQSLHEKLPETSARVVYLNSNWQTIDRYPISPPEDLAVSTSLAYVIYTSGSTGRPKGVLVEHAGMVNLVYEHRRLYGTREGMRVSQTSSASFDSMGAEVWPALLSGATLCIVPDHVRADAELLQRWLIEQAITVAFTTTIVAERLLDLAWPKQGLKLRVLRFGGERFRERSGKRRYRFKVYNEYGPTEDTVCTTVAEVTERNRTDGNIGRPIANHQVYVLDENQNPVPVGQIGELGIGGIGLARGYLKRTELTAEKFIANPLSDDPKGRLYRTGDLARFLPDGSLAFVGRIDGQLKIRGFRIELGEIEVVLTQHPSVRECVVIARENAGGDKRLVAYIVARQKLDVPTAEVSGRAKEVYNDPGRQLVLELRHYLSAKLPDFMVPANFVFLDEVPLTPNGKIDRRALPEPKSRTDQFVVPRTALERKLAKIWQDVLAVECVGAEDNFFELGGDSLSAVRLANRLGDIAAMQASPALILQNPTVAQLAAQLSQLDRSFEALAKREVAPTFPHRNTEACAPAKIPRLSRASGVQEIDVPTSLTQQSVWLLDQLRPRRSDYNIPLAFRVCGDLNIRALERSLSYLVERHEVLRTTIRATGGEPMQFVGPARDVVIPVTELRELEVQERLDQALRLVEGEAWTTFDLAHGPLLRAKLFRLQETEHVLFICLHHIIGDDWSNEILMDELLAGYEAFTKDSNPELPDLPIQYGDYANWQRELLNSKKFEEQLQYWRNQLSDLLPLQLPTARQALIAQTASALNEPIELSPQLVQSLKSFSESEQVTFFMTILAGFQILLARYSGQEDVVVGSPIVSRSRAEAEALIGLFLNTLVLRTRLDGNPTFREVLSRVREMTLEAYQNQDLPFESVVETLAPTRDPNRNPLFQVMFNMMSAPPKTYSVRGLTLDRIEIADRSVLSDLTLNLFDGRDSTYGYLNYNADLFEMDTVRRMVRHFQTVLEGIAANPNARISELPLLTPDERRRMLFEWNDTRRDYPTDIFLHQFVEREVERRPNAVAVIFENRRLTYRELNQRANRLAHYLRKRGVGPDKIVGILAERSFEMWIGILAILKAGGGYLPLDPTYPIERLAFLLQDAKPAAVLTQRRLATKLPPELGRPIFLEENFNAESEANPVSDLRPENLACVIYTSGSTGKPKGVLNSHGGLSNWLRWMQEIFPMSDRDTMLQKSPFNFDVSVREFFLPLSTGGRVVIATPGMQGDSRYLVETIRKHAVTAIHFVPPMLAAFLEDPEVKRCTSLRLVVCSGDALTFDLRDKFFAAFPDLDLHNMWGATEHAPESSYYKCGREPGKGIVPVGRPGANTQLYILDRMMQPVPVGIVGEAYLGGIQTALGYLSRPKLTAEKFLSNPFVKGKLYKTGDLGRFRPDGVMEFVGRADHQIKLRGFRVELGEIESVLKKHPAVCDCVVVVQREEDESSKHLVAYLVAKEIKPEELRPLARRSLPEHMVPTEYVFLDRIPVTTNGKIDRSRLPQPERQDGARFIGPRTLLQRKLAVIWESVLGIERVGLEDNFFDLGGNSLLAVRIVSDVERTLGKRLSLFTLFQAPTIARLAAVLQSQGRKPERSPVVPIQPHGSRPPFFAVHTLSGEVMLYQELAFGLGPDQPFYGIQADFAFGSRLRRGSIETIARRYVKEIRQIQACGPYYLGGYCIGGVVAFEMAQQLHAAGESVGCLVLIDTIRPESSLRQHGITGLSPHEKICYCVRKAARAVRSELGEIRRLLNRVVQLLSRTLIQSGRLSLAQVDPVESPIGQMLLRAQSRYEARVYPGRIMLLRTAFPHNPEFSAHLGWQDVAEGGVEIFEVPGEHLTIFESQHIPRIAERLDACIRKALSNQVRS